MTDQPNPLNSDTLKHSPSVVILACGALAKEILLLKELHSWADFHLECLDAKLHSRPELIVPAIERKLPELRRRFDRIILGYGDCGTGGGIDALCAREGLSRLEGAHCYAFFAGLDRFDEIAAQDPGTFYLTDFLARNFDNFVVKTLGLDRYPQLRDDYFGNYNRLVYIVQFKNEALEQRARKAADFLGLEFELVEAGMNPFSDAVKRTIMES